MIKCARHRMVINTSKEALDAYGLDLHHERYGSRCDSQRFVVVEERAVNRETAQTELIVHALSGE